MTREDAIRWIKYLSDDARSKADSLVPTNIEIACGVAIDALKAQEPRVLALEEADKTPYVWLESDQGGLGVRRVRIVPEDSTAVCIMAFGLRTTFHESGNFEKHFRCWSEKPSDEQREATPWMT